MRSLNDDQRTVLVVDDHAELRLSVQRLLERAGYRVLVAGNGAEGLEQLRSTRVHVVVLDIDMPVMNGRMFLAARSKDAQLARVPVVVYSADPRPAALPAGITAWIWKGTESAELLGAIEAQARR
ncbi:MAG TPA: response regulator [Myxococcales bacterium]|nr:response regulator [Myxococcales bacterium]